MGIDIRAGMAAPEPVQSGQAAEFVGRLAEWARKNNAINVNGFNPALSGTSERERPDSDGDEMHAAACGRRVWTSPTSQTMTVSK